MRQKSLLKTMLLLCALIVGSGSTWGQTTITDELTASDFTATTSTYIDFSNVIKNSDAVYAGNSAKDSGNIQMRSKNSNSGIVSTTSGGTIKSVKIFVGSGSNTIDVYGSNEAYSSASDLYGNKKGTKVGSLSATGTVEFDTNYKYVGIRSNSGAIYLSKVEIVWEVSGGGGDTPATYTVTYDKNGNDVTGSVPTDAGSYTSGSTVTVLGNVGEPALAKTGYAFGGWCMNAEGTGTVYGPNNTTTFAITANTTLYAKWTPYIITAASNDGTYGTVELNGFVITASPAEGYTYASPAYTVYSGSATVEQDGNKFTVTPTSDCTVTINFKAKPKHTATFSINGSTTSNTFYEGQTISFPDNPATVEEKVFVGWVTHAIMGTTDEEPEFVTSVTMGDSDITYYAVFAEKETTQKVDKKTITIYPSDFTSLKESYSETSTTKTVDNQDYTITIQACLQNNQIQMRDNATISYIHFPQLPGNITNVSTTTCNNAGGSAYSGTIHLKTSKTRGNTNTDDITSAELSSANSFSINVTNTVSSFYLVSSAGLRLSNLTVAYEVLSETTVYSDYCTTVAPDTRDAVNMTSFTATNTTLVIGGTPNTTTTTIANDQSGWTAAYTYESDNTDVATVDENGVITAVAKGTANITAKLNVDKDDENYKAGTTKSMSIEITVVKPSYNVAFYDNGTHLDAYDESYEEGEDIIFPDAPSVGGYVFIGWATAAIDGTAATAPSTVTSATMGTADITYYAVYGDVEKTNVTATFDASNISSNLTEDETYLMWTENNTGIVLSLSAGQHYTNGTPNTFTVTKGTSNYFNVEIPNGKIIRIVTTIDKTANSVYIIGSVSNGATLGAYDNDTETQTVNVTGELTSVYCYAKSNYQIRASKIVVDAVAYKVNTYLTSLPTTTTVTLAAACTDGTKYYGTFSSERAFVVPDGLTVSEIGVIDGELLVESYETGAVIPANTGVMISSTTAGEKTLAFSSEAGTSILGNDNSLRPSGDAGISAAAMSIANANCLYYRLTMHDADPANNIPGTIGFWWGAEDGGAFALAANKAYLAVPKTQAARMGFAFGDNTQSIEESSVFTNHNSQSIYNLQGQRILNPNKGGLYIVNGKKVILK